MPLVPAWNKVVEYARDTWGEGGGPTLNPPEYADRGADACMNEPRIKIQWAQQPSCSSMKTLGEGTSKGADATISFVQKTGSEQSGSWTVTKSSEITNSISFNVGFEYSGFSAGMETSFSATVKNERFTMSNNNMQETTVTYENKDGNQCKLEIDTQTCRATGKGVVPIKASGFVWFYYPSPRASKNNPGGSKHYHWAVQLSRVLTEEERTSLIEFQGPMNTISKTAHALNCTPLGASKAVARTLVKPGTNATRPSKTTSASPRAGSTSGKTATEGGNTAGKTPAKSTSTKPRASSNPKPSPRPRAPQRKD
ncbi:hypothetical protein H1R20_g3558, partial [Candolleomyces eurysporus]